MESTALALGKVTLNLGVSKSRVGRASYKVLVCIDVMRWNVDLLFFNGLQSVNVCAETMPAQAKAIAAVVKAFESIAAVVSVCIVYVLLVYSSYGRAVSERERQRLV